MPLFDTNGAPTMGLNDCKIAVWNGDGTYGSLVDVPSVQMFAPNMKMLSAQLEGDDQITATSARLIGAEVRFRFGSISLNAAAVLFGLAKTTSGGGASLQDAVTLPGGHRMPYFGICGKALAEEGEGDLHVFLPKVKIMSDFDYGSMEYGRFAVTELSCYAVSDEDFDLITFVEHAEEKAITFPPTGIS